jgi:spermidine synthase
LVGLATLLFEILLTRIFSLTMWYHFAFVAISLGLFGIGAGGVAVTVAPKFFGAEKALDRMGQTCLAFGLSIPIVFAIDLQLPFVPFGTVPEGDVAGLITAYALFTAKFLLLATPFFCSGLVLAIAFTRSPTGVHKVYFADLVGGGIGCALAVPVLLGLSGPSAVVLTGVFPFLAATLMFQAAGKQKPAYVGLVGVILVLALVGLNQVSPVLKIERVKSYDSAHGQTVEPPLAFERWHPVSRVAVFDLDVSGNPAGWFYSEPLPPFPRVMEVTNDGGARTYIYPAMSQQQREELFRNDLSDIMYALTAQPRVLVVGVGGGKDVQSALTFGASHVRAVEMNPVMIEAVQDVFGDFSGRPYDDPRVEIVIDEARNHVESHDDIYDAISISVTDTWAASSVGAYALTESYLYTAEAFDVFMSRLSDGGWLSITRWYPQETLRLVALVVEGLRAQGVEDPESRLLMARNDWTSTLLVKNGPVTPDEDAAFRRRAQEGGFPIVHTPSTGPIEGDVLGAVHRMLIRSDDLAADAADLPISVEPPTDDQPFFFHFVSLKDAFRGKVAEGSGFEVQHGRALALLMGLLRVSIVVALVFVLGPVLWMRRRAKATAPLKARLTANLYFLALGFGYLLAEIPMMQNFILFLGNPIYSLSVVLFSMLVFSGLGSLLAERFIDGGVLKPVHAPLIALVVLIVFRFAVPLVFEAAISLPIAGRLVVSVITIAPIGLALGAPFPVGLSLLHRTGATPVPWAWAINGAASVAAPVIATTVAILAGFSTAYLFGAACYAAAALLIGG